VSARVNEEAVKNTKAKKKKLSKTSSDERALMK